jgi:DNA-binding transcriptional MocR family regulator
MPVVLQQPHANDSAAAVVSHVRQLIDSGSLGPGARLPPERDLAREVILAEIDRLHTAAKIEFVTPAGEPAPPEPPKAEANRTKRTNRSNRLVTGLTGS